MNRTRRGNKNPVMLANNIAYIEIYKNLINLSDSFLNELIDITKPMINKEKLIIQSHVAQFTLKCQRTRKISPKSDLSKSRGSIIFFSQSKFTN